MGVRIDKSMVHTPLKINMTTALSSLTQESIGKQPISLKKGLSTEGRTEQSVRRVSGEEWITYALVTLYGNTPLIIATWLGIWSRGMLC